MSYWFLPGRISHDARSAMLRDSELQIPAAGLPDLSRAHGADQIGDLLRKLQPEAPPESITAQMEHYWQLGHSLLQEDKVVMTVQDGTYMIGELTGAYRREARENGMCHIWPAQWHGSAIDLATIPKLSMYAARAGVCEIEHEEALVPIKTHIPDLKQGNVKFFRWLGIIILIFELIYFWPKS